MGRPLSALLHDTDPTTRSMLERAFTQEGWHILADGDEKPTVMVMTLRSDEGLSDLERLRTRKLAGVPLIVLGAPALRAAAIEAGAREFLPLPLFVRDAVTVAKMLAAIPKGAGDEPEIRGPISELGLYFLLRAMAGMQRSGILQLRRGPRKAELRFVDGEVVAAQVGPLHGVPAIFLLLLWDQATVSLRLRHVPRRGHLGKTVDELLAECERFLRDFLHAARDLGSSTTVYGRAMDGVAAAPMPQDVHPIYRLFDGRRTLCDVIGESPFRIFDTLRIIGRLIESGAIQRRGAAPAPPAVTEATAGHVLDAWHRRGAGAPSAPPFAPGDNEPAREKRGFGDRRKTTKKLVPVVLAEERRRRVASIVREDTPAPAVAAPPAPAPAASPSAMASGELRVLRPRVPTPDIVPASTIEIAPEVRAAAESELPQATPLEVPPVPTAPISSREAPRADRQHAVSGEIAVPPAAHVIGHGRGHGRGATPPPVVASTPPPVRNLTPTSAFSAIEHDFFAREADLYKHEKVENFDDLDGPEQQKKAKRRKKK